MEESDKTLLDISLEQAFSLQQEKGGFLQAMRIRAFSSFQKLGLPKSRDEAFRYVRIRSLLSEEVVLPQPTSIGKEQIQEHVAPECKNSFLVLVNGIYEPALSCLEGVSQKIEVMPLEEGMRKYGALMQSQWAKEQMQQNDPFSVLSAAFCSSGVFLYLPPAAVLESLQIIHVLVPEEGKKMVMAAPRVEIVQARGSHTKIYCNTVVIGKEEAYLSLPYLSCTLEEEATCIVYESKEKHSSQGWQFASVKGRVKKNALFRHVQLSLGCKTERTHIDVSLLGEGANTELDGLALQQGNNQSHVYVVVRHEAAFATSRQLYKSALYDASKFSFEGKIFVAKDAQKTDAFQLNNNLLLGEGAEADSKPNLEIYADDVKASHGATCGRLSEEQKFYLLSRGLSQKEAIAILVEAYCQEVVTRIPFASCQSNVQERMQNLRGVKCLL
jgi:Fe-S cluster assembly protein SufD